MQSEVTRLQKEEEEGNSSIFSLFCKGKLNHSIKVLPQFTTIYHNLPLSFQFCTHSIQILGLNRLIGLYFLKKKINRPL